MAGYEELVEFAGVAIVDLEMPEKVLYAALAVMLVLKAER